jgi:hypothetical protein
MTDLQSLAPRSSPLSAGRDTADERRRMIENEATLIARLVLVVLGICWLALWAHMFHIFG